MRGTIYQYFAAKFFAIIIVFGVLGAQVYFLSQLTAEPPYIPPDASGEEQA
jgi:hypothetical protein